MTLVCIFFVAVTLETVLHLFRVCRCDFGCVTFVFVSLPKQEFWSTFTDSCFHVTSGIFMGHGLAPDQEAVTEVLCQKPVKMSRFDMSQQYNK